MMNARMPPPLAGQPRSRPALPCVALFLLVAAGCGGADGPRSAGGPLHVHDSAGVNIVEVNTFVVPEPGGLEVVWGDTVRIGHPGDSDGDPAYLFGMLAGAARLSDGRVVVADMQASQLRFFGPDGVHLRSVGRRGDGPGEFTAVMGLARLAGDSLFVLDRSARWSLFDGAGEFVQSGRFDLSGWAHDIGPEIDGVFSDGTLFVRHRFRTEREEEEDLLLSVPNWRSFRADRAGAAQVHFDTVVGPATIQRRATPPAPGQAFTMPTVSIVRLSTGPTDAVRGDRLYRLDRGGRELRVIRADGTLERIVRFTEDVAEPASGSLQPETEALLRELPRSFPDRAELRTPSLFRSVVVDEMEWIWLRLDAPPADEGGMARWVVLDPEGIPRHSVDLPPGWNAQGLRGMDIGREAISAPVMDELQVSTVLVAPLRRP